MAKVMEFGVVVNIFTGVWGYETYEDGKYVETIFGFKSYEAAFEDAMSKGYEWECKE